MRSLVTYRKFSYEFGPKSCFEGFYGSVCELYAIGVYVKPVETLAELKIK